jgi:zinc D-Ala-D-Ala dipeptidase
MCRAVFAALLIMCCEGTALAKLPQGFVDVAALTTKIRLDIRYATPENFTGRPVPGYNRVACWLREEVAAALARAAEDFAEQGYRLVLYDCYRPQRAVDAFVAWSKDTKDQLKKSEYYPDIEKPDLIGAYIGAKSSHAKGIAVDLGLEKADGTKIDFGTAFDFFGPTSKTANAKGDVRKNRQLLLKGMARHGFTNYPGEWWHFAFDLKNAKAQDVPID